MSKPICLRCCVTDGSVQTFTPLVSPAVTPHDSRFQMHDMTTTVPGAYFTPLTSPALNAQNYQHPQTQSTPYGTSSSSTGASPIDVDMEMLDEPALSQSNAGRKLRSGSKRSAPRSAGGPSRVRQSPIVKPRQRKATVLSLIPPKEVTDLLEEERATRPSSNGADLRQSRESSESDSISPGPLSDMGPPPKPGSVNQSPALNAQGAAQGVVPATPASLMRIHPSPTFDENTEDTPALDDLILPEATLDRPSLSRIITQVDDGDQETPRLVARKTPKLGPLSTPSGASAQSGRPTPSPMLSAMSTPTSPFFPGNGKKVDPKGARPSKKRNSIVSNLVSPALRPKISPSIKPLLPDGCKFHPLQLESRSNYRQLFPKIPMPFYWPPNLITKTFSMAQWSPACHTQLRCRPISHRNALRIRLPNRVAGTVSTRH